MTKKELEDYIKMRCAMILSDDYKAAGAELEDIVEDIKLMEYVCPDPVEF